jgi:hypothetical protein
VLDGVVVHPYDPETLRVSAAIQKLSSVDRTKQSTMPEDTSDIAIALERD